MKITKQMKSTRKMTLTALGLALAGDRAGAQQAIEQARQSLKVAYPQAAVQPTKPIPSLPLPSVPRPTKPTPMPKPKA